MCYFPFSRQTDKIKDSHVLYVSFLVIWLYKICVSAVNIFAPSTVHVCASMAGRYTIRSNSRCKHLVIKFNIQTTTNNKAMFISCI